MGRRSVRLSGRKEVAAVLAIKFADKVWAHFLPPRVRDADLGVVDTDPTVPSDASEYPVAKCHRTGRRTTEDAILKTQGKDKAESRDG